MLIKFGEKKVVIFIFYKNNKPTYPRHSTNHNHDKEKHKEDHDQIAKN